jgi:ribosome silencing factor RsfS/YbeB/iojap
MTKAPIRTPPEPRTLALLAARCCLDKGAEDVRVMLLPEDAIYGYLVLASARSDRQAHAVIDEVWRMAKEVHAFRNPVEGDRGWMLVDLMDVVVHCLDSASREHYDIDHLWPDARELDVEAELKRLPAAAVQG